MSPVRVGTLPRLFRGRKCDLEFPQVVLTCVLDSHVDVLDRFAIFDFEALDAGRINDKHGINVYARPGGYEGEMVNIEECLGAISKRNGIKA